MTVIEQLKHAAELQRGGQLPEAEKIYLKILNENPENVDAKHLLGLIRGEQGLEEEAIRLIRQAIESKPREAGFHHNIAGIYRRTGDLKLAEQEFRNAISLKPDYGEAYQGLSEVISFQPEDPLIKQTIGQVQRLDLDDKIKSYFYFAAAKMHQDIKDYDTAFHCYRQGNNLCHRTFDTSAHRNSIKDTIYVFSDYYFRGRPAEGVDSEKPIFVIGMPRSGTTLVEQILASHTRVFGAGELNRIKQLANAAKNHAKIKVPYPHCVPLLKPGAIERLANEYLEYLKQLAPDPEVTRVVDKHPLNFRYVGLILKMFPRATIIHTQRDPLDTCLSCFFQNFSRGQDYSFNLTNLGHFYNDYRRLMEHWQQVYPNRIYTIGYENLVGHQEEETRKLIAHCHLPWEDACLTFHKTRRTVKTASFMQVRQPIYNTSMGRWRRYREHIKPLAQILGINLQT